MTATIWARQTGSSRELVSGVQYADVDPTDDDDVTEIGRQIAKQHGVKKGSLEMEVRGGPRSRKVRV